MSDFFENDLLPGVPTGTDFWQRIRRDSRPILIYGMGNGADKLAERLALFGREPAAYFASDAFVRGQSFRGERVVTFREAIDRFPDGVILVSFGSPLREVLDTVYAMAEKYLLFVPDMPLAGEEYFTAEFARTHAEELRRVYGMLADEPSRTGYAAFLRYKLTAELPALRASTCGEDRDTLLPFSTARFLADVGAYRGDTLRQFLQQSPCAEKIWAIEPDPKNFRKLREAAQTYTDTEVCPVEAAAWDEDGEAALAASGNRNTGITGTASFAHRAVTVKTVRLDTVLAGCRADIIKYDTEGAEAQALRGSAETIRKYTPALSVSVYHRSEDIFALPLLIEDIAPGKYRYFFRRKECIPGWEADLIALPLKN